MRDILYDYDMNPTTWVYLSSLLIIGIYFKFHRFWSIRNLDLVALIVFSPGLLLVRHGLEGAGYVWLFSVSLFFLVRLLLDPLMVRRPLLEPNLSASGLTFSGTALLIFLMANVVTGKLTQSDLEGARRMDQLLVHQQSPHAEADEMRGPGYPLFYTFASFSEKTFVPDDKTPPEEYRRARLRAAVTRGTAILAHLLVVVGMVLIGYRHFDNVHTGVAAACLYLMLPYTAQMTPRVDHVIPAVLLVWAIEAYRRPVVAGLLLGLAGGLIYYPFYLLPLWCGFYWRRGLIRFAVGVGLAMLLLIGLMAATAGSPALFLTELRHMFGCTALLHQNNLTGFWKDHEAVFRIPVLAAFVALSGSLALWPAQKNLGTLLSCSAAVMLGAQFWHAHEGGLYMAWYLPLLVLTIFRPNLEDRVALSAISEGWLRWRKSTA